MTTTNLATFLVSDSWGILLIVLMMLNGGHILTHESQDELQKILGIEKFWDREKEKWRWTRQFWDDPDKIKGMVGKLREYLQPLMPSPHEIHLVELLTQQLLDPKKFFADDGNPEDLDPAKLGDYANHLEALIEKFREAASMAPDAVVASATGVAPDAVVASATGVARNDLEEQNTRLRAEIALLVQQCKALDKERKDLDTLRERRERQAKLDDLEHKRCVGQLQKLTLSLQAAQGANQKLVEQLNKQTAEIQRLKDEKAGVLETATADFKRHCREMQELERKWKAEHVKAEGLQAELEACNTMLGSIQTAIGEFQSKYARCLAAVEALKAEMHHRAR